MDEFFSRVWEDFVGRIDGPMKLRLIVQPMVACILAIRAGLRDVREGRPPLFWALAFHPDQRRPLLRQAWKDAGTVFLVGALLDVVYQIVALHTVYVGEAIVVAVLIVVIPYAVVRAAVARVLGGRKK